MALLLLMVAVASLSARQAGPDEGDAPDATRVEQEAPDSHDLSELGVDLTPRIGVGPAQIEILVRVPQHPDNRALHVSIDSGGYYRGTEIALEGAEAAVQHYVLWRGVPAGHYTLTAVVSGIDGERERVSIPHPRIVRP